MSQAEIDARNYPPELTAAMNVYVANVADAWRRYWQGRDHRYGSDFAAFLGERLLTDFDARGHEPRG